MRDDEEDDNIGSGYNRSPHASGRETFGNTSSFNTALISEDGRFLGIKVSPSTASTLNVASGVLLDWASKKADQLGIKAGERGAKLFGVKDASKIRNIGGKTGNIAAYGIILGEPIANVGSIIYDTARELHSLNTAVRPLVRIGGDGSHVAPLSGSNEVIANSRHKITGIFWHSLLDTAGKSIKVLPALTSRITAQSTKNAAREKTRELESAAGDKEKIADIFEKELAGVGTSKMSVDEIRQGTEIVIERARKRYEEKFQEFAKENSSKIKKEIAADINKLKISNLDHSLGEIEKYKIDTRPLRRMIEGIEENTENRSKIDNLIADAIKTFKDNITNNLDAITGVAVKTRYVGEKGAFDDNWTRYQKPKSDWREERELTQQEKIEQEIRKIRDAKAKAEREAHSGHDSKDSEVNKMAATVGAALVGEVATKVIGGKSFEQYKKPIAIDYILHLRRVLEKSQDDAPEQVPGIQIGKQHPEKDMSYVQYVHQVFQQHQRDCHRPAIGERFTEHFDDARWNDEAIQKMPDAELTSYEYAVKTIAKRIKDGRMDAIALINLVGDRTQKIVGDDGRSFGPRGSGKNEEAVKQKILKLVDGYTAAVHAGHSEKSEDAITEQLGNFIFSVADVKKALDSTTLDTQQRAVIFTLFSDAVGNDKKLCEMLGISETRCHELRKETQNTFNSILDGSVIVLAEMIANDPEGSVKNLKLTEKEKTLIASLAEQIQAQGKDVVDLTKDRQELKSVETVVANATMTLKDANNAAPGFWTKVVEKTRKIPEMLAEGKKRYQQELKGEAPETAPASEEERALSHRAGFNKLEGGMDPSMLTAVEREANRRGRDSKTDLGLAG